MKATFIQPLVSQDKEKTFLLHKVSNVNQMSIAILPLKDKVNELPA